MRHGCASQRARLLFRPRFLGRSTYYRHCVSPVVTRGAVYQIHGFTPGGVVPLTSTRTTEVARVLGKTTDSRATIGQARGALMLLYGLGVRTAFAPLTPGRPWEHP